MFYSFNPKHDPSIIAASQSSDALLDRRHPTMSPPISRQDLLSSIVTASASSTALCLPICSPILNIGTKLINLIQYYRPNLALGRAQSYTSHSHPFHNTTIFTVAKIQTFALIVKYIFHNAYFPNS